MKEVVVQVLNKALKELGLKLKDEEIEKYIEAPPNYDMGDYAFPCFIVANMLKSVEPHQTALEIREKIGTPSADFDDIQTVGPYVNFYLNRKNLATNLIKEILTKKQRYGKTDLGKGKKILIDFSSPNIGKPFGIGHIRSTIIGNSLANISEFQGFNVTRINYPSDWGTQFGRLISGYSNFGSQSKLEEEPIKHLYEVYVKANQKEYDEESRKYFKELEDGDDGAVSLWESFRELSLTEFKKIYAFLGIKFDDYEFESEQIRKAKTVIKQLREKKIATKSQGALVVNLKRYKLGVALIEKSDEATLYLTRDLAAAIKRYNKYKFDRMIYEVGQEQKLHFKQLFKILELMGYSWAKNCVHVDHGLYLGKDRKKFSTRKGKTVFFEDILDKTLTLARKEIKNRFPDIPDTSLEARGNKVAIAAIFYGDLKSNRSNDVVFDIKKFVSFDGNTGPYILYSYARASSIIKKSKAEIKKTIIISDELEQKEVDLVKKLSEFPVAALNSYLHLNPALVANYVYDLAQTFNEFYQSCPVIKSGNSEFRLSLVESFRVVLKNALNLLGIEPIEEM